MEYGGLGSPNTGLTLGLEGTVRMEGITTEADVGYVQAAMMQDLQQQQLLQQQPPPPQPEEPMGLESHFQFLPLIIEILRHMSTIANQKDLKTDQEKIYEKQLRDKVVALNEKFKRSQVILEELEGTELTRQQQQEVYRESLEKLRVKSELIEKYSNMIATLIEEPSANDNQPMNDAY